MSARALLVAVESLSGWASANGRRSLSPQARGARADARAFGAGLTRLGARPERLGRLDGRFDLDALERAAARLDGADPAFCYWSGLGGWHEGQPGLALPGSRSPADLLPLARLERLLPPGVQLVLDAGFVGPGRSVTLEAEVPAHHPRFPATRPLSAESPTHAPAFEVLRPEGWRGAWSAALGAALDEAWSQRADLEGDWLRRLRRPALARLQQWRVPQVPVYTGPGGRHLGVTRTVGGNTQIWAGDTDCFTGFEIRDFGGALLGWCVVVTQSAPEVPAGLRVAHDHWHWLGAAWPARFRLVPAPANQLPPGAEAVTAWVTTPLGAFTASPVLVPARAGTWLIQMAGVSGLAGALWRDATSGVQSWYLSQAGGSTYLGDAATLAPTLTFDASKGVPRGASWSPVVVVEGG